MSQACTLQAPWVFWIAQGLGALLHKEPYQAAGLGQLECISAGVSVVPDHHFQLQQGLQSL